MIVIVIHVIVKKFFENITLGVLFYRYGFNGKENDNEVKGEGNQQDYGMRIYDPRVARFLSVDPIAVQYPELTPYQFAENSPVLFIDLDGLEKALPWYLRENKYGDKPVLTLGLGNLPLAKRIQTYEGTPSERWAIFLYNTGASAYNGIAGTWNDALDGKSGAAIVGESFNAIQELELEDFKNVETWENVAGGVLTAYATKKFGNALSGGKTKVPFVETPAESLKSSGKQILVNEKVLASIGESAILDSKNTIIGTVSNTDGILDLFIKTKGTEFAGRGGDVFKTLVEHASSKGTVTGINGTWSRGSLGSNLEAFN